MRCKVCGLEHDLWVTQVPSLGRHHGYAPLGFDGSVMMAYGHTINVRVRVSTHLDFTVAEHRGGILVQLCQWCVLDLERRSQQQHAAELRGYDQHVALVTSGQLHLPGEQEWWCV